MHVKHIISAVWLLVASMPLVARAETNTVRVSTAVQETCRFYTQEGGPMIGPFLIMSFPEIDPADTQTFIREASYKIRCSKGTQAQLLIGSKVAGPLAREMDGGFAGASLRYELNWTLSGHTGSGFGPLSPALQLTLSATLTPADYQDALAGHYTDNVPVELNP